MARDRDDSIHEKLDKIDDRLLSIDKTLVRQEENLREHMRRTDLLESDVRPIKQHVAMFNGVLKFLGVLALLAGIAATIKSLTG